MLITRSGELKYYEFKSFADQDVCVRFYSRQGGVSPEPWSSLNQGGTVGDLRDHVVENRRKVFADLQRPVDSIFDVWQVHGNQVICTDTPRDLNGGHQKADAIFTDKEEITLFMRFADCVPIVLFEPQKRVVGIVHAGWQGTVNAVVVKAVESIRERYGVEPGKLMAGIGPSIGPDHYQVRADVSDQVLKTFGASSSELLTSSDGNLFLNLWKANELLLRRAGVAKIETSEICTACNTEDWYSHRKEKGKTGRFGAAAFLR